MSLSKKLLDNAVNVALNSLEDTSDPVFRDFDDYIADDKEASDSFIKTFEDLLEYQYALQMVDNDIDITRKPSRWDKAISNAISMSVALVSMDSDFINDLDDRDYRTFLKAADDAEDALDQLDDLLDDLENLSSDRGRDKRDRRDTREPRRGGNKSRRGRGRNKRDRDDEDTSSRERGRTKRNRRRGSDESEGGRPRSGRHATYNAGDDDKPKSRTEERRTRRTERKRPTEDDDVIYANFSKKTHNLKKEIIPGLVVRPQFSVVYDPRAFVAYATVEDEVNVNIVSKDEMEDYEEHEIKGHVINRRGGGIIVPDVDFTSNVTTETLEQARQDITFSKAEAIEIVHEGTRLPDHLVHALISDKPLALRCVVHNAPVSIPTKLLAHLSERCKPMGEMHTFHDWLLWMNHAVDYAQNLVSTVEEKSICAYFISTMETLLTEAVRDVMLTIDERVPFVSFRDAKHGLPFLKGLFDMPDNIDYRCMWDELEVNHVRTNTLLHEAINVNHHFVANQKITQLYSRRQRLVVAVQGDLSGSIALTNEDKPSSVTADFSPEIYDVVRALVAFRNQKMKQFDFVIVDALGHQYQVLANNNESSPTARIRRLH